MTIFHPATSTVLKGVLHDDLEDLLRDHERWPEVADMVRAEMIPASRMAEIARDHPEFWETIRG